MEKRWGTWPQFFKGLALSGLGEYRDAVRTFRKAFEQSGRQNFVALSALGHVYGIAGMYGHARDVLQRLQEMSRTRYVSSYEVALIHLGLGEEDLALGVSEQGGRGALGLVTVPGE